mmetsp:Transcript_654/g.1150  ORF Transcript_654/g.1150 Transcript_654/m.1150 type:complete len:689 (-) Transcript_654:210-2276(-)
MSGLHRTTAMQALWGLCTSQSLPGGSMKGRMAYPDNEGIYRSARSREKLFTNPTPEIQTMADMWRITCEKFSSDNCMGWRDILSMTKDGNKEKFVLSGYNWITYRQAYTKSIDFGAGLVALGMEKGDIINFYADTKAQWQLGCQGCLSSGFCVATIYANLGAEAVAYSVNQTECSVLFTDCDLIPIIEKVIDGCPNLKHIVFTSDNRPANHPAHTSDDKIREMLNKHSSIQAHSFDEVVQLGEASSKNALPEVNPEDSGVIMYTSGSTGNPKGVVISHRNLVAGIAGCSEAICGMGTDDVYLAYLPLAHILELIAECSLYSCGVAVGYGSPKTLTDASVCIEPGACKGDATELRPTLMAAVPMIMDKIRAGVLAKVNGTGGIAKRLFDIGYKRKLQAISNGNDSPFWNRILFDNIRARLLGGRVRYMLSGGGPLSKETQDFMNVVFCCPVGQGWGLTETVGVATICWPNDRTAGRVGAPICSMQIKLEDWEEGGYYANPSSAPKDQRHPHPRGELLLGGPQITMGYYKEPEKSDEAYFVDDKGVRWLRTGDIGEIYPDGVVAIIDRKKDLVKLSGGEYVSLGKLEPIIRDSDYVDNAMVYCDSQKSYCVAIVQVSEAGKKVSDEKIKSDVASLLKKSNCAKFEIPKNIKVEREIVWGPENDLCTAALKLKRRNLVQHYDETLQELYKD